VLFLLPLLPYSAHEWTDAHVGNDATIKKLMLKQAMVAKGLTVLITWS